jgi:hypothetical protein
MSKKAHSGESLDLARCSVSGAVVDDDDLDAWSPRRL